MKTLIVYASKYGCTADCAAYLKTKLSGEVVLVDIEKVTKQVELSTFDIVTIGGSIYMSKIAKKLKSFCESNHDALSKKKVGIFLCAALAEQFMENLKSNFSTALLESAKSTKLFGSEVRMEKMKFFDKAIIKTVSKGDFDKFKVSKDSMDAFIQEMS